MAGFGADDMIALMNNPELLMKSSTGGTLSKTGMGRDADGTIDRSPPPTPEVQKVLKEIKRGACRASSPASITLASVYRSHSFCVCILSLTQPSTATAST